MSPRQNPKPSVPPDCPRQYHDDYIGRSGRKVRGVVWLAAIVVVLVAGGIIWVISQGGLV